MTVSVLVPYRPGCPHREAAWDWVYDRYRQQHPDWQIVTGASAEGPFSRSQGILDAFCRADGDVLVVADADVYCDPQPAVDAAAEHGWAIPHLMLHRLSEASTSLVLAGDDWHGLPLSEDNRQDSRPYKGHETDTLVVIRRDVFEDIGPDPRFVGWGREGDAWSAALRVLFGKPWRGSDDLVHLHHPPQERRTRVQGSEATEQLWRRYKQARHPLLMRRLIEEAKEVWRGEHDRPPSHAGHF